MAARHSGTIGIAFEMLLEAIDKEVRAVMERGIRAFETHDFQQAADLSQRADLLKKFRQRVEAISQEWEALSCGVEWRNSENRSPTARTEESRRLPKGSRTPESAFFLPILRVLDQMGGSGRGTVVLDQTYELIASQLNAVDFEPLPHNPREIRWRNTAKWARKKLIERGLLRRDSPKGVWEITDAGREYLRQHAADHSSEAS